jgi:copper chaperone CopZ
MKTYTFHVKGTHCASCKILIEDVLGEQDFVKSVRVDLSKEKVNIETESEKNAEELAQMLTEAPMF